MYEYLPVLLGKPTKEYQGNLLWIYIHHILV